MVEVECAVESRLNVSLNREESPPMLTETQNRGQVLQSNIPSFS